MQVFLIQVSMIQRNGCGDVDETRTPIVIVLNFIDSVYIL